MTTVGLNTTHDVADPLEDAYARAITFTVDQADWIAHHVRNSLVALALITEQMGATPHHAEAAASVVKRLVRLAQAAELGVRSCG